MVIDRKDKLRGIVYAYTNVKRYDMVRDAGANWTRRPTVCPWTDKINGTVSPAWEMVKEDFRLAKENGLNVMPTTHGMGSWAYQKDLGKVAWRDSFPAFYGPIGSDEFYANVKETGRFMCADLGDLAGNVWQCMNEIDLECFRGHYPIEVAVKTCRAFAEGIVEANPNAICGTNFAGLNEHTKVVGDMLFAPGHKFGYVGDDQYYGSWHNHTVEKWQESLDEMWDRWNIPIVINEWGYSSGGGTTDVHPDPSEMPEGWSEVCFKKTWYHNVADGPHTEELQAEYVRRGLEIFANHPHVLGSFLFCFSDAERCWKCGQSECPAECFWGLVRNDLSPKPAYFAYQKAVEDFYLK